MTEQPAEYNPDRIRRDNALMRKYAAMQRAAEDKTGCPKIYVDMVGDIEQAMILDELVFYTLPRENGKTGLRVWKNGFLWLAVGRSEWWERKRIKEREADLAIKRLEEHGLIVKEVHRFNNLPKVHIRLVVEKFFELYFSTLEGQNPPENDQNTTENDLKDLYEMMGMPFSPNGKLPNGEGNSPNGDSNSPNGENINNIDTAYTQHSVFQNDKKPKAKTFKPQTIEQAIYAGLPVTEELQAAENLRNVAPRAFEKALGFSTALPWWSNKEWTTFAEWVCVEYRKSPTAFGEYNIWRNTKYVKGGISNNRLRGFVNEFYDSWDMFQMSREEKSEPENYDPRAGRML